MPASLDEVYSATTRWILDPSSSNKSAWRDLFISSVFQLRFSKNNSENIYGLQMQTVTHVLEDDQAINDVVKYILTMQTN